MKLYNPTAIGASTADSFVKTGGTGTQMLMADGTVLEITPQKEVTANYSIVDGDNKYTIFLNSATAITVTINTLTTANFECDFYNLGVGAVTFVNGTATVGYPDGTILNTDKVCALIRVMATTTYKLKGELV